MLPGHHRVVGKWILLFSRWCLKSLDLDLIRFVQWSCFVRCGKGSSCKTWLCTILENSCILKEIIWKIMNMTKVKIAVKSFLVIKEGWLSNISTHVSVFDPRTGRKWRRPLWSQWPSSSLMTCGTFVTEKTSKTSATEFVFVFLCCRNRLCWYFHETSNCKKPKFCSFVPGCSRIRFKTN